MKITRNKISLLGTIPLLRFYSGQIKHMSTKRPMHKCSLQHCSDIQKTKTKQKTQSNNKKTQTQK